MYPQFDPQEGDDQAMLQLRRQRLTHHHGHDPADMPDTVAAQLAALDELIED